MVARSRIRSSRNRVVNRFGEVSKAFAFGGENEQIRLLKSEGVEVDENGRVDLKKYGMV